MDSPQNILIRADSSYKIGTGHIMRDLVLASEYKEANIIFATQELEGNINHKIQEAGYSLEIVYSNKKDELLNLIENLHVDLLIIDNYDINHKTEKYIKEKTGVKILALDDTYEKHYCDILLNHNISARPKKYKKLVPKNCELRCGAKYTLLREEFLQEIAKQKLHNDEKKSDSKFNVFLAMGGADSYHMNITVLKILKKYKNIKTHVVTTQANKNLQELESYAEKNENLKLHVDEKNIAMIMSKCDFAIVTPSVIVNEVIHLGLPLIAVMVAKNQADMYKFLKKKRFYVLKKSNMKKLSHFIDKMLIQKNYMLNIAMTKKLTQ